jgi:hypothetical protein
LTRYLCQYAKLCPVYQGKEETDGTSLPIYKNVFCNRGYKGWGNCEKYEIMRSQHYSKRLKLYDPKRKSPTGWNK